MSLVIDASMALAITFDDAAPPLAERVLSLIAEQGAHVPAQWFAEVADMLLVAERRGRISRFEVDQQLALFETLPLLVDADPHAWKSANRLARQHGLSLHDAAYLELAIRLALPLASLEGALIAAAERHGLTVIG